MLSSIAFKGMTVFNSIYYGNGLKQISSRIKNDTPSATTAPWDFLDKNTNGGAFDSLTKSVESSGASLKRLVFSFALAVAAAAIIIFGLQLILGKNGAKKQELKDHLPWVIIGVVLIVGFTLIFTLASSIVAGIQADLG